jgi:hypothetical protein
MVVLKKIFSKTDATPQASNLDSNIETGNNAISLRMAEVLLNNEIKNVRKSEKLKRIFGSKPNVEVLDNSKKQSPAAANNLEGFFQTPEQILSGEVFLNPDDINENNIIRHKRRLSDDEYKFLTSPESHNAIKKALEAYVRFWPPITN